jgi:hypothetical protein
MNWNDFEAVWKRQGFPVGASADLTALRETFEAKRRKMAATLLARDLLEASAGVLSCAGLGFAWWQRGRQGLPLAASITLILGVTAVFVCERIRTYRHRPKPDASLLAKVNAEIAELQHQRRLIRSVGGWYYAPCFAALIIGGVTLSRSAGHTSAPPGLLHDLLTKPVTLAWIIILAGTISFVSWMAWRSNRDAVQKHIEPRIEELEKLRRDLIGLS